MKHIAILAILVLLCSCSDNSDNNTSNNTENNEVWKTVSEEECAQACDQALEACDNTMEWKALCSTRMCYERVPVGSRDCLHNAPCEQLLGAIGNITPICGIQKRSE